MIKMNNLSKEYKILYSLFSNYDIPSKNSLNATQWLNLLEENKKENKLIISASIFLKTLAELGHIQKIDKKSYIPSDENYQNGFIEVSERTIITYKGKIKEYTVLFTDKGQKKFLPIIKELISKKEQA